MSKMISKMNLISVVQQLPKEDVEIVQNYVDMLENEIENLSEQVDYLRSGEYLNQLRFERDMLQHVVDTNGVPSEVYDYLDCTHRNTELLEESQKLKKQLSNSRQIKNQQKEFIEWLESNLEALEMCDRELILTNNKKEIKAYKEVLSKYKEIIGVKDE